MSIDSADSTGNVLRQDPPSRVPEPAVDCEGCRERSARIEQLERRIEQLEQRNGELEGGCVASPNFSPNRCYWICLATHALITAGLFSSPYTLQIGLVTTLGTLGTLLACHAFSTRSLPARLWRTVVALSVVFGSAAIPTLTQEWIDGSALAVMSLFYLAPILLAGWFVAKIFVWTRGWRLVPPGGASEFAKLRIRHLLIWTFVAAVLLTAARLVVGDQFEALDGDVLATMLWAVVPAAISTSIACALARILLSRNRRRLVRKMLLFAVGSVVAVVATYLLLLGLSGEVLQDVGMEALIPVILYAAIAVLGLMASPLFTFGMMRAANYRLIHP